MTNPTPSTLPVQEPAGAVEASGVLVKALHRIVAITTATPAMNEQKLGLSMGIIQEVAEATIASLPPVTQAKSEAVAEIRAGNLAWHIPSPDYKLPQRFLVGLHKLYAAPQEAVERQPLTETKREELWRSGDWYRPGEIAERNAHDLMKAVEAAHGIGPATQEKQHG